MKAILMELLSLCLYLAIILGCTYLTVHYVGQRMEVTGTSMEPILQDGDNLLVDKLTYRFKEPERFDVIVFPYRYEEDTYYIKRIIGLPGDKVQIDAQGTIWINEEELEDPYGLEGIRNPGIAITPIILEDGEYFVLGDNRNDSSDSRDAVVGIIRRPEIIGKAVFRIYPFSKAGRIKKNAQRGQS